MFYDKRWFVKEEFCKKSERMQLLGKYELESIGRGKVQVEAFVNGRLETVYFANCMYLPNLRKNLVSIGACERAGATVTIDQGKMKLEIGGQVHLEAKLTDNNLYEVKLRRILINEANTTTSDIKLWHGHVNLDRIRELVKAGQLNISIA